MHYPVLNYPVNNHPPKIIFPSYWNILYENRLIGDIGNSCLLSVDGTDFLMAMSYCKDYYS